MNSNSRRWPLLCGLTLLCCLSGVTALAAPRGFQLTHREPVSLVLERDAGAVATKRARLRFDALSRRFDLTLESNASLLNELHAAGRSTPARLELYRGVLSGIPQSWARVSILGDHVYAMFSDGTELYSIEPPPASTRATNAGSIAAGHYIFRLRDLAGTFHDVVPVAPSVRAGPEQQLVAELEAARASLPLRADVGFVSDFDTFDGADAESALITVLSYVEAIYEEQVGILLNLARIDVFDGSRAPFDDTSDVGDLLVQVSAYRFDTPGLRNLALVHLYTGRVLSDDTIGAAYQGTVCDAQRAVGLTQLQFRLADTALVTAHEMGHNFGAPHDGEVGSPCALTPPGEFLMSPTFARSDIFSQCSRDQMAPVVTTAACLYDIAPTDVAVSAQSEVDGPLWGVPAPGHATVANTSAQDAYGVSLVVSRTVTSFRIDSGACVADSTLQCTIGALPAGSAVDLDFEAIAGAPIPITASAANDTNPTNDTALLDQHTKIAVNLSVAVAEVEEQPARLTIRSGESTEVLVTVENLGSIDANEVTITVRSGLEILEVREGFQCPQTGPGEYQCAREMLFANDNLSVLIELRAPVLDVAEDHLDNLQVAVDALEPNIQSGVMDLPVLAYGSSFDLGLSVHSDSERWRIAQPATVSVVVKNYGPDAAPLARWSVEVPPQISITNASSTRADCALDGSNIVRCEAQSVEVEEEALVDLDLLPNEAGGYDLVVTKGDVPGFDPRPENDGLDFDLFVEDLPAPPPPPPPPPNGGGSSGGGGGGGATLPELLVMAVVARLRAMAWRRREPLAADGTR